VATATHAAGASPKEDGEANTAACRGAVASGLLTLAQHCTDGSASCCSGEYGASVVACIEVATPPRCVNQRSHTDRSDSKVTAASASAKNAARETVSGLFTIAPCKDAVPVREIIDSGQTARRRATARRTPALRLHRDPAGGTRCREAPRYAPATAARHRTTRGADRSRRTPGHFAGAIFVTVNAPPTFSAWNFTLSPALT